MHFYPKEQRHFRGFKSSSKGRWVNHPAYIVGEDGDNYLAFHLTHSKKRDAEHVNHALKRNPDPDDGERQSYMKKHLYILPKIRYSDSKYENFRMSEEDDAYIDGFLRTWAERKGFLSILLPDAEAAPSDGGTIKPHKDGGMRKAKKRRKRR